MKLSTRSMHGLRVLIELALEYGTGPILLQDIAEHQHIPPNSLNRVTALLQKARIIARPYGLRGGYVLARDPGTLTLYEIIDIFDNRLKMVDCSSVACCEGNPETCMLNTVLTEASQLLVDYFGRITLLELVQAQLAITPNNKQVQALSYTI